MKRTALMTFTAPSSWALQALINLSLLLGKQFQHFFLPPDWNQKWKARRVSQQPLSFVWLRQYDWCPASLAGNGKKWNCYHGTETNVTWKRQSSFPCTGESKCLHWGSFLQPAVLVPARAPFLSKETASSETDIGDLQRLWIKQPC